MQITEINPHSIQPVHEVREPAKLETLKTAMQSTGWTDRPLVVVTECDGYAALTGSHRIAAAIAADVREVPCVVLDDEAEAIVRESNGWSTRYGKASDLESIAVDLRIAGFTALADLIDEG